MVWILLLALAALAAAVAMAARRGLVALQDTKQDAWGVLEAQLVKRHELMAQIVALCAKPMRDEREVLDRVSISGSAVLAAAKRTNVPALAAADKSHRTAVAALFARAGSHAPLSASAGFAKLRERTATLDARVDERREQYNSAVSVLNFRCHAFPYSLVARTMGVRPAAFLP
ncbi:MAG: LemA family protein [Steroidobacteraceae bacterium]